MTVSNGDSLNGIHLNGTELNGIQFNGIQFNGIQFNGIQFNGVQLSGTKLIGTLNGTRVEGADFSGATLVGILSTGQPVAVRVDSIEANPDPANADILLYTLSFQLGNDWLPLCGTDANGVPGKGSAFTGRWDLRQGVPTGGSKIPDPGIFTFACVKSVIFECAAMGYKPWATFAGVNLENHHQACTRMLRADYCGDGTPHTVDGTPINIYDGIGIQLDAENWKIEAEWNTGGALCFKHPRVEKSKEIACWQAVPQGASCGALDHFTTGTLLMSETSQ